jgi:hypothetical protein
MRTITPSQRTQLESESYVTFLKVETTDSDGAWRDVSTLGGADYLISATWTEDIDQPVAQGTVTLMRGAGTTSLSPLMSSSTINRDASSAYAPFLDAGRRIRLSTATVAPGTTPLAGDFVEVMQGKIDTISWGTDQLEIAWRDLGGVLQDTIIEEERVYGGNLLVEAVMQEIITDNYLTSAITLVVEPPEGPGWVIGQYKQERVSILEAIRALALQIGYDVRYKYDSSGNYNLTFYLPDRNTTTALTTIGPGEYESITDLNISDADVRNVCRVKFLSAVTGLMDSAIAEQEGSIAEFGRRYMEIGEGSSSNIDTMEEAGAMATAAVADLALPKATQVVDMLYWWPVQLGDLYTWTANGVHYDQDQTLAVTGFTHTIGADGTASTEMRVRGTVAGAYRQWLLTRNGDFTGEITHGPAPLIGPIGGEASAFGGGPNREGMIWLRFELSKETERVEIYAVESATSPVDVPELSESRKAWTIRRQDGDVAGADNWTSYVMVATRVNYYRKLICIPIGYDGERGPMTILESQAVDVGTGPAAAPSGLSSTSLNIDGKPSKRVTFTVNDGASDHLVFRNGFAITDIPAGTVATGAVATFDDVNIDTGVAYTYDACAFRSFQTSAFAGGHTEPPSSANPMAPRFQAGYPQSTTVNGAPGCIFAWIADATATEVWIEVALPQALSRTWLYWTRLGDVFTGASAIPTGSMTNTTTTPGTSRQVRVASRFADGTVLYSASATAVWGTAPTSATHANPQWVGASPYYDASIGASGATVLEWSMIDSAANLLEVEEYDAGSWVQAYSTSVASEIAHGIHNDPGTLLVGKTLRLKATFPDGAITYSGNRTVPNNGPI